MNFLDLSFTTTGNPERRKSKKLSIFDTITEHIVVKESNDSRSAINNNDASLAAPAAHMKKEWNGSELV